MAADVDLPPSPAWQRGKVASWLVSVDHRRLGILYLGTGGFFLLVGGLLAVLMRIELVRPDVGFLGDRTYLGLTTFHGTALVFFFALPLVLGLANAIVPLMVGARSDAYPRVNAVGFWLFLFGGLSFAFSALSKGPAARSGWTADPPRAIVESGKAQDLVLIGLVLVSLALLVNAVNLLATIRHRAADGMRWSTLPVFAKSVKVFCVGLLVAAPLTAIGSILLLLARRWPSSVDFFVHGPAGQPTLRSGWVWLFGQPVAYLLLVPALGIAAEIVATFTRGRFDGARIVVASLIAFSGLVVLTWLHHTVSSGAGRKPSTALLVLAVLAAIPVLAAIATIARSGLTRATVLREPPVAFALATIVLVALGALSGLFLAIWGNDRALRGTAFATGHAHYLLYGPALFALLGGLVYWWPKLFGRLLDPRLVSASFGLLFTGFLTSFFMDFVLGDEGVAVRSPGYAAGGAVEALELLSSIAAFGAAVGALAFAGAALKSLKGRRAGNDPWTADTLEWYTSSPPPAHNFDALPSVTSDRPLYDLRRKLEEQGAL